jgi:hypothetical protein
MPKTVNEGGYHPASGTLACSTCHDGVVDDELEFINPSKHIDGKVNIFGNDYEY